VMAVAKTVAKTAATGRDLAAEVAYLTRVLKGVRQGVGIRAPFTAVSRCRCLLGPVGAAGGRVALTPSRSDAVAALAAAVKTWIVLGCGAATRQLSGWSRLGGVSSREGARWGCDCGRVLRGWHQCAASTSSRRPNGWPVRPVQAGPDQPAGDRRASPVHGQFADRISIPA
jgi:hypothetical protein